MDYRDHAAGQTADNFWFAAKRDLIRALLARAFGARRDLKILNMGAGTGDDLAVAREFGRVWVVDISPAALAVIPSGACEEARLADARELPYPDGMFDAVLSFDVFEHIDDAWRAAAEARRVLAPGGALLATVPAHPFLFGAHDRALGHFRRHTKSSFRALLSGFDETHLFYWNSVLFLPAAMRRLRDRNAAAKVDVVRPPRLVNALLYRLMRVDDILIRRGISPPPGLSIASISRKGAA